MRRIIYGLCMLVGFAGSLFASPDVSKASIDAKGAEQGQLEVTKATDTFYFTDIMEQQKDSGFLAYHYSHRSHSSHYSHSSHQSHRSHYSSRY